MRITITFIVATLLLAPLAPRHRVYECPIIGELRKRDFQ
jgi:hypothetical protein